MPGLWKKIRYRLEWAGIQVMVGLLPRLPRAGISALARTTGEFLLEIDTAGRAVALANLQCAFGDTLLPSERESIARRSLQNFAQAFFDLFWGKDVTPEQVGDLVELTGFEFALERHRRGQPSIFMTHHFGNFEVSGWGMGHAGFPLKVISQEFKNPLLTELFLRLRSPAGHQIIHQQHAVIRLFKGLKQGESCGFFVDFTMKLREPGVLIDTFGLKKWVTPLQVMLAEKTGAPLIPTICLPLPGGRYELRCLPPIEVPPGASRQEVTQLCWDVYDPVIRQHPELWMWIYKHWRYRPESATNYPFYANPSQRFEKLLAAS